jgi:hypothetical protein
MKKLTFILILAVLSSCNPQLHMVGAGMRYHNLSQNKYQPGKHRKQVNIGTSPFSPVFLFLRNK